MVSDEDKIQAIKDARKFLSWLHFKPAPIRKMDITDKLFAILSNYPTDYDIDRLLNNKKDF
jgi:hypothetical protein